MKERNGIIAFFTYKDYLSNFYNVNFKHMGKEFKNSEQAIMWRKALLFNNNDIAEKILSTNRPIDAKILGRSKSIKFDQKIWDKNKENIYFEVLFDKFNQNHKLKTLLLNTGDKKLVEASPYDKIWGCGLSQDDPNLFFPEKWKGLNLLGNILERVRIKLK